MKKILLIITLSPLFSFCQTLEVNKVDDFTKATVKRTSYEPIVQTGKMYVHFRVSKIDDAEFLDMKLIYYKNNNKMLFIEEGMKIMIMLQNDSVVILQNVKYAVSCTGCGSKGFMGSGANGIGTSYHIFSNDHTALKSMPVKKIRIYTTEGFIEDEVKDKRGSLFIDLLKLIN